MKKRGIDKLFKEELKHLQGDFEVGDWESMESLLDEREPSRRRPLILWLSLVGLAVTGLGGFYLLFAGDVLPDVPKETTGNIVLEELNKNDGTEPVFIESADNSTFPEEDQVREKSLNNSSAQYSQSEPQLKTLEINNNIPLGQLSIEKINEVSSRSDNFYKESKIETSNGVEVYSGSILGINEIKIEQEPAVDTEPVIGKVKKEDLTQITRSAEIEKIKTLSLLVIDDSEIVLNRMALPDMSANKQMSSRVFYSAGLSAYVSTEWYPYSGESIQQFRGYSAGAQYSRLLDNRFLLSAGLGVRQVYGTFGATDESVQTVFNSFGWTRDFHSYKPSTAIYLETPIYAGYIMGRHHFSGGIRLQKLVGLRAEHLIEEYNQTQLVNTTRSEVSPVSTRSSTAWVRSSAFNDVRGELAMSYGLALAPKWSLQAEGRYGLNGILINDDDQDLLREYKPVSLSVRLNMKL